MVPTSFRSESSSGFQILSCQLLNKFRLSIKRRHEIYADNQLICSEFKWIIDIKLKVFVQGEILGILILIKPQVLFFPFNRLELISYTKT